MGFNPGMEFNASASQKHGTDHSNKTPVSCANNMAQTDTSFALANQRYTNDTYSLITAVTIACGNLDQTTFKKKFQPHLEFHFKHGTFPDSDYVKRKRRNTDCPFEHYTNSIWISCPRLSISTDFSNRGCFGPSTIGHYMNNTALECDQSDLIT
jgi:hypothetical protein